MNHNVRTLASSVLVLIVGYGMVLLLYFINRPFIDPAQYLKGDPSHLLNQSMLRDSDYQYLLHMMRRGISPSQRTLRGYLRYFDLARQYTGQQPDLLGLSGFCHYYLGETEKAILSYKQALTLNPTFFWYHYNLGTILYNEGRYQEALLLLSRGLQINPELSMRGVTLSPRHYMQMAMQLGEDLNASLVAQMMQGRKDAQKMIILIQQALKNETHSDQKFPLRIY